MIVESLLFCIGSPLTAESRNNGAYLYMNEQPPIYTGMPSASSEEVYAPNILLSNSLGASISDSSKASMENYQKLLHSFNKYVAEKDEVGKAFKKLANQLCRISAKEILVQYNASDEALDIQMVLMDGVVLSVSQFVKDTEDVVDFTIRNHKKMLVCGEMNTLELLAKIKELEKV